MEPENPYNAVNNSTSVLSSESLNNQDNRGATEDIDS
jgi:hypothetical protein